MFKKKMNREENSDKRSSDLYRVMMCKPWLPIELDILYRIEYIRMESSTDIKSEHIIIGIGTI